MHVQVRDGLLEGEVLDNVLGGQYYSFKGIPYAAPPVGDLRFKAPQPVIPWDGVRSAKAHGPICHQFDMFTGKLCTEPSSEDCLYLNVYSPDLQPKKPLPVMFWIHGGGFLSGSGNTSYYGPDFLVNQNVVLVTFNYRLAVVGFLCLHTKEVPGNAGMKDQVAALKWVKDNIRHFGGDPDNVTIFGESAGAASVTYHLVSPMSKGLFKRAIAQSGVNLSHWAQAFEPRLRAEAIARSFGKDTKDDEELYELFKSLPIEKITNPFAPLTLEEEAGIRNNGSLAIVDEKEFDGVERFFFGDVYERLKNGIHDGVELMEGYTTDEGVIQFAFSPKDNFFDKYNNYVQCLVPQDLAMKCSVKDQLAIGQKVKEHYFSDKPITTDNIEALIKYFSMHFSYNVIRYAKIFAHKDTNKLFFYQFDMYSERNIWTEQFGGRFDIKGKSVCHCDDLPYLFSTEKVKAPLTSEATQLIQNMTKLWTNFAKFGDPTPDSSLGVKWPAFDPKKEQYLIIGNDLVVASHPNEEEYQFWEKLHQQYLQ
ncbi:esterase FE4-like [Leguminivora glycinivorella]|uniref:esterase FE4-like n=1 Tax=Leguminivora glycinivorella TaxID=1035111 RepID=UPI00200C4C88|nr:esterase FE4-like [Leguminivora glycinivorella]